MRSASGAAAYSLYSLIIKNGGAVFGVRWGDNFHSARYVRVTDYEGLNLLRQSKYVETDRSELFNRLSHDLNSIHPVLVIGLPCDIAAVRTVFGYPDNLVTAKLICRSNTSSKAFAEYVDELENNNNSKIVLYEGRYKREVDNPKVPYTHVVFENGIDFMEQNINNNFSKTLRLLERDCCSRCSFKGEGSFADISIGDFYGLTTDDEYYNSDGVSLCVVHTEKGQRIINQLHDDGFYLKEVPYDATIKYNWMIHNRISSSPYKEQFRSDFVKYGLQKACSNIRSVIKKEIDNIVRRFSNSTQRVFLWGGPEILLGCFIRY